MTVWNSINVTLDPSLRDRLIDGSLSRFVCGRCGAEAEVNHDLLYHDMERRLMIFLADEDGREKLLAAGGMPIPGAGADDFVKQVLGASAGYRMRVVADRNELLEKVWAFEDGLDDRALEAAKAFLGERLREDEGYDCLLLYEPREEGQATDTLTFAVLFPDGRTASLPAEGLGRAVDAVSDYLGREEPQPQGWVLIDREYGRELLLRWAARQQRS
jgi:hypothetical protein